MRISSFRRNWSLPVVSGLLLALGLPLAGLAQGDAPYNWDSTWPKRDNETATRDFFKQEGLGVAVDRQGRIYMSHNTKRPVIVYDREGNFLSAWTRVKFGEPHGIKLGPDGNIWVADRFRQQVMKLSPDGELLDTYGVFGTPGRSNRHFNQPTDVAFGLNGDVYVSDGYKNSRVVQLTSDLQFVRTWGTGGSGPGQFRTPHGIDTDTQGRVYVADRDNRRIQIFSPNGNLIKIWKLNAQPADIAISPDGRAFVANVWAETISIYDLNGNFQGKWGRKTKNRRPGAMAEPHQLDVDTDGAVYAGELRGHRWQRWLPEP